MWMGFGARDPAQGVPGTANGAMGMQAGLTVHNAGASPSKGWTQQTSGENPLFLKTKVDVSDRQYLHPIFITSLDRGSDRYPFLVAGAASTFFKVSKNDLTQAFRSKKGHTPSFQNIVQ